MINLSKLAKQLFGSKQNSISYYQLYQKLRRWKSAKVFPSKENLPNAITFPTDFWTQITKLFKETRADNHERAVTLFWADGDLIITPTTRGTTTSVKPRAQIRIAYKPTHKPEYYTKHIILNDKTYKKTKVYYKKIPKKIELQYLFNMHTHPPHPRNERAINQSADNIAGDYRNQSSYSFWSKQDIKSFLTSNAVMTGLITDRLLLLIRTNKTPTKIPNTLKEGHINETTLSKQLHLGVYQGEFKHKVFRE